MKKVYEIKQIDDQLYTINDDKNDTCYVLIAQTKAMIIDLTEGKEPIKPIIEKITTLPCIIVATHGHGDHVGRSGEFDKLYMSLLDMDVFAWNTKVFDDLCLCTKEQIQELQDGDVFDLGGLHIEVVGLPGHTPGSMLFVCKEKQCVFTGDAIGSGCGVWMQLPHSTLIKEYQKSLQIASKRLELLGVNDHWKFYGGHDAQEYESKVSDYNRLDFQLLKDMEVLCKKILHGEVKVLPSKAKAFSGPSLYAAYHKAEMIYSFNKVV